MRTEMRDFASYTDPHNQCSLKGRGSGESIQMLFQGDGFVVIQPQEKVYFQTGHQ